MGHLPQSCAVVEDSAPGIQAAISAEMNAFRYNPHGQTEFVQNVPSFDDMRVLPALLKDS